MRTWANFQKMVNWGHRERLRVYRDGVSIKYKENGETKTL